MQQTDVIILGGGLAGLTLALQLSMDGKKVALVDRRPTLPPRKQKVGESTVQVGGYYLGKILDLEEYLQTNQFMKYNLRFYWKSCEDPALFENYSQAYIRNFSNIPCYQTNRNALEAEVLSRLEGKVDLHLGAGKLKVALGEGGAAHQVGFEVDGKTTELGAPWVVDTSGRSGILANQLGLAEDKGVDHGASFCWIEGVVDIERLTDKTPKEIRTNPQKRHTGHLPQWLGTNHFMGEGYWFWVIPIPGMTSLGLVYDNAVMEGRKVSRPDDLLAWARKEFPLFKRALDDVRIVDSGGFKNVSYGCRQTLSKDRWAISGEAGRFSDPLYSPGTDLIALHNCLIHHAICHLNEEEFESHQFLYELLMKSLFDAFLPTFNVSYDALGDQETFVLKYTWELSVYFSFFTFPFINELFPQQAFILPYLEKFGELGPINKKLHEFIKDYYHWKDKTPLPPHFHELTSLSPLQKSADTFFDVGLSAPQAIESLDNQLTHLKELALFTVAHIAAQVTGRPELLTHPDFIQSIHLENLVFDPKALEKKASTLSPPAKAHRWSLNPEALRHFARTMTSEKAG